MKNLALSSVLLTSACLWGCSKMMEVVWINNTGSEVTVQLGRPVRHEVRLPNGVSQKIGISEVVIIAHRGTKWTYFNIPTRNLPEGRPNGTVVLQIEPDGLLYRCPTTNRAPVSPVPPQPEGFPVHFKKPGEFVPRYGWGRPASESQATFAMLTR